MTVKKMNKNMNVPKLIIASKISQEKLFITSFGMY